MNDLRFGYTVMWVKNASRSAEFYAQAFGLQERTRMQTAPTPWIEIETGVTTIAFAE
jgi:catechol 2,3-dioxygenase-like lactoylglutathione lyase family enzyme